MSNSRSAVVDVSLGCLSPSFIPNKKEHKREYDDSFLLVPCGRCINCRRRVAKSWQVRLLHEQQFGKHTSAIFCTLTISNDHYEKFEKNPSLAIRRFLERYRKKYGTSLRHFFVTELGEENSRLHFHGIVYDAKCSYNELRSLWGYGISWFESCRSACASYIVKYITKQQFTSDGTTFIPQLYVSPGLGKQYIEKYGDYHRSGEGRRCVNFGRFIYAMPRYYYTSLFSDEERLGFRISAIFDQQPHTYRFRGSTFTSSVDLQTAVDDYYRETLLRRTSTAPRRRLDAFGVDKKA